ncbi:MAG: fibronectin type III domain-containing protein [Nitrospira sp.]|nr:fibronectin type III domain-containing protein [Nitrospira sp.]
MIMTRSYHLLLGVVLLILTACAAADPVLDTDISPHNTRTAMLSWDPNPGADLAGYKIYLATASGSYGAPIATTSTDTTSYTVTGLVPNTAYFFVVTAFTTDGAESTFSNEASTIIL